MADDGKKQGSFGTIEGLSVSYGKRGKVEAILKVRMKDTDAAYRLAKGQAVHIVPSQMDLSDAAKDFSKTGHDTLPLGNGKEAGKRSHKKKAPAEAGK